jgi:hypothetical protein
MKRRRTRGTCLTSTMPLRLAPRSRQPWRRSQLLPARDGPVSLKSRPMWGGNRGTGGATLKSSGLRPPALGSFRRSGRARWRAVCSSAPLRDTVRRRSLPWPSASRCSATRPSQLSPLAAKYGLHHRPAQRGKLSMAKVPRLTPSLTAALAKRRTARSASAPARPLGQASRGQARGPGHLSR